MPPFPPPPPALGRAAPQVRTLDRGAPRTALFLHGLGPDRSGAFFAKWWCVMAVEGYNVLALDMPGHGRSCEKPLPTRSGHDGDLVLAVLAAFGAGPERPVTCFADAGGVQAFLLALRARPALFGGHHVLLNPIVSDTAGADALKAVMEAEVRARGPGPPTCPGQRPSQPPGGGGGACCSEASGGDRVYPQKL